jgi:hypothetical protein
MTMIATIRRPSDASTLRAGVNASLVPTELGYASGLALLSRFAQLMMQDGLTTDTRRMQSDSAYAFEQLALAHKLRDAGVCFVSRVVLPFAAAAVYHVTK